MPIGYSPDDVLEAKSSIDKHLANRITWKMRPLSVAESRKVKRLVRESSEADSLDSEQSKLNEALAIGIVGWDRPEPYSIEAIDSLLSPEQKCTLADEYPSMLFLAESEKKALRLRQASAAAASAKDAGTDNAKTSPTNQAL